MAQNIWKFNELAGTTAFDSVGSLDFSGNAPLNWSGQTVNKINSSTFFENKPTGLDSLSEYTIHVFCAAERPSPNQNLPILARGSESGWMLAFNNPTDKIVWSQTGIANMVSNKTFADSFNDKMYLVTMRKTATNLDMFIEGVLDSTVVTNSGLPPTANIHNLFLNQDPSINGTSINKYFDGYMGEVKICDYAETDIEIRDYFRSLQTTKPEIVGFPSTGALANTSSLTIDTLIANSGDLLLSLVVAQDAITPDNVVISTPAGWTKKMGNDGLLPYGLYYKVADGLESPTTTWNFADGANAIAAMIRIVGTDSGVEVYPNIFNQDIDGNSDTHFCFDVGAPDCIVLNLLVQNDDNATLSGLVQAASVPVVPLLPLPPSGGATDRTAYLAIYENLRSNVDFVSEEFRTAISTSIAIVPKDGNFFDLKIAPPSTRGIFNNIVGL